jgi:hypothetical protein
VAPLPSLRVNEAPPFTITGLDYAGPVYCCDMPGKKLYILLCTCAVVRAVHLEVTDSLSLKDFMLAVRRFAARRGLPSVFFSDNAKTFLAAKFKLREIFGHLSPRWQFIVARSPWWGGWWERLVRSMKSPLKKSVGRRCLSRVELETVMVEIEACINSRPLTFVGDTVETVNPLTPSHFLIGRCPGFQSDVTADFISSEPIVTARDLQVRETQQRQRLQQFWLLWSSEYLRSLPPALSKFYNKGELQVGSVVLIREDKIPRLKWPLAVVVDLYPGSDRVVRSVKLKTAKGYITRSVQRLHSLEICDRGSLAESGSSDIRVTKDTSSDNESSRAPVEASNVKSARSPPHETVCDNSYSKDKQHSVVRNSVVCDSVDGVVRSRSGRVIRPNARLDL